ncbi:MAG TPA: hypothetical protein VJN43_14370 [Bryobacteraceae bacterium]|nr:hypothetical protein [Bryobacteraceae bacterium]
MRSTGEAAAIPWYEMPQNDASVDSARRRLTELRNGLLHLHKTLLDSESSTYDHDIARITSRGQLLELVLHDPWFAWLHELSGLVVLIDELLDGKEPVTETDARRLIGQARALIAPPNADGVFRQHYLESLQRDPNVVMAHSEAMKLLASLG